MKKKIKNFLNKIKLNNLNYLFWKKWNSHFSKKFDTYKYKYKMLNYWIEKMSQYKNETYLFSIKSKEILKPFNWFYRKNNAFIVAYLIYLQKFLNLCEQDVIKTIDNETYYAYRHYSNSNSILKIEEKEKILDDAILKLKSKRCDYNFVTGNILKIQIEKQIWSRLVFLGIFKKRKNNHLL